MKPKYCLEIDTGGVECDRYDGRWASYGTIVAEGDTLEECLENAGIDISDQDGGELDMVEADEDWMQALVAAQWYEQVLKLTMQPLETMGDFLARCERSSK